MRFHFGGGVFVFGLWLLLSENLYSETLTSENSVSRSQYLLSLQELVLARRAYLGLIRDFGTASKIIDALHGPKKSEGETKSVVSKAPVVEASETSELDEAISKSEAQLKQSFPDYSAFNLLTVGAGDFFAKFIEQEAYSLKPLVKHIFEFKREMEERELGIELPLLTFSRLDTSETYSEEELKEYRKNFGIAYKRIVELEEIRENFDRQLAEDFGRWTEEVNAGEFGYKFVPESPEDEADTERRVAPDQLNDSALFKPNSFPLQSLARLGQQEASLDLEGYRLTTGWYPEELTISTSKTQDALRTELMKSMTSFELKLASVHQYLNDMERALQEDQKDKSKVEKNKEGKTADEEIAHYDREVFLLKATEQMLQSEFSELKDGQYMAPNLLRLYIGLFNRLQELADIGIEAVKKNPFPFETETKIKTSQTEGDSSTEPLLDARAKARLKYRDKYLSLFASFANGISRASQEFAFLNGKYLESRQIQEVQIGAQASNGTNHWQIVQGDRNFSKATQDFLKGFEAFENKSPELKTISKDDGIEFKVRLDRKLPSE